MSRESVRLRTARLLARAVVTRSAPARAGRPIVSFTFDDVHASAATLGASILERHGARGTFYVSGGLVGVEAPDRRSATLDQCLTLSRRGHEIACHTYSHRSVLGEPRHALTADIARNRAFLDAITGPRAVRHFAYPFNQTSLRAKSRLQNAFATCRGGVPGINTGRVDLGFLRAVELFDGIDSDRASSWIGEAVRQSGWLVFFSHGVSDAPEPWRCPPELLDAAVAAARAAGCDVLTVSGAFQAMFEPAQADSDVA